MSIESKGIYHWKLGDVALARVCQKAYARVRVVKDEKGLFYDDKVLGISGNEDGSITVTKELCYYVETCRTNHRFWLPYTSLHLAERSRPFYGNEKETNKVKSEVSSETPAMLRKRKVNEEHIAPLEVDIIKDKDPEPITSHNQPQPDSEPERDGRLETAFKEFVRRGKEQIFDRYLEILKLQKNEDYTSYLRDVNSSTEKKFEFVIKAIVTKKEVESYLSECWRYNFALTEESSDSDSEEDHSTNPTKESVTLHTPWCLVCGVDEKLRDCATCPAAFHVECRSKWLLAVIHRKNPPNKISKPVTVVDNILSSTRVKCTVRENEESAEICPSCLWGPTVGYNDIVWNKLGPCGWWPARVLPPGEVPSCLLSRTHSQHQWPLRYYGTLNHSWGSPSRTCLFLPSHTGALSVPDSELKDAVMDANDDYIAIYLT